MTNFVTTKRALLTSVLSLVLCFAMLLGTTFAWFTDTVTSSGNVIQTGNLDVEMYYAKGTEDPAAADWKNAENVAIFDYDNWEPGYADAKHIKIVNNGTLAFDWTLRIISSNTVSDLAEVIDVYYFESADAYTRASLANATLLGTLRDVMNTEKNISRKVKGTLNADTETAFTLVLVMQEDAGNEYQGLSIGSDLSIQVFATQRSYESDSFDNTYDDGIHSLEVPAAYVRPINPNEVITNSEGTVLVDNGLAIKASGPIDFSGFQIDTNLDAAYQFLPTETLEESQVSDYRYWHADYVITCDRDVVPDANGNPTLAIAGYYDAWCSLNDDQWIALASKETIKAGTEIRLVSGLGGGGITVSYEDICRWGNDGLGFMCGAVDLTGANEGATLTVELRIYEVTKEYDGSGTSDTTDVETGNYITIGEFNLTFGGEWITLEDGTVLWAQNDGEVVLYDTQNVETVDYTVPEGVTKLGNYCFSYTDTIETVTLSESVTSLGRAFDTNSTIKKVVLNEGLETIDPRAFRATSALEEVVISSTVKTIADNAFQKSAIKTITIPATVETIGETAFGASKIETVIIEGNTSIQGYAFRGCPNLRTVYLNGDDVTFIASTLNGRNSMWFCNGESNNPNTSNITFYVKNATVAARVYAAMGAEAGNTPVIITDENGNTVTTPTYVANDSTFDAAIADGTTTLVLGSGTYTMPAAAQGKTLTIAGNGKTVVSVVDSGASEGDIDYNLDGSTITFENVTLNVQGSSYPGYARVKSATYNNCTIVGANYCLYGDSVFNNCTFNLTNGYVWTWGAANVEFNNCTFESADGSSKAILVHNTVETTVTVRDCTFKATTSANTWDGIPVAAVSIDPENGSPDATVYFEGTNTYSDAFHGLYQVKYADEVDDVKVYVDGTEVTVPVGENDK